MWARAGAAGGWHWQLERSSSGWMQSAHTAGVAAGSNSSSSKWQQPGGGAFALPAGNGLAHTAADDENNG